MRHRNMKKTVHSVISATPEGKIVLECNECKNQKSIQTAAITDHDKIRMLLDYDTLDYCYTCANKEKAHDKV